MIVENKFSFKILIFVFNIFISEAYSQDSIDYSINVFTYRSRSIDSAK